MKKTPLRKDLVSKEMLPKEDLLRIALTKDGTIYIDLKGKGEGRGAYIKKDLASVEILIKKKLLEKAFNTKIPEEFYLELKNLIMEGENYGKK